jgi:hypothetical protein
MVCILDLEESQVNETSTDAAADESEIDEVFSTRAYSLTTVTPASSLHEDCDLPRDENTSHDDPYYVQGLLISNGSQSMRGHANSQSSSSSQYPRRVAITTASSSGGHASRSSISGANRLEGGDEGPENPDGPVRTWESDEAVNACRLCNRRFTTFLRRHHCRYFQTKIYLY